MPRVSSSAGPQGGRSAGRQVDRAARERVGRSAGRHVSRSASRQAGRLTSRQAAWSAGWQVDKSAGRQVTSMPTGRSPRRPARGGGGGIYHKGAVAGPAPARWGFPRPRPRAPRGSPWAPVTYLPSQCLTSDLPVTYPVTYLAHPINSHTGRLRYSQISNISPWRIRNYIGRLGPVCEFIGWAR